MIKWNGYILSSLLLLSVHVGVALAQETTVTSAAHIGGANLLDTYLTAEKYRGTEWRITSDVRRDSKLPSRSLTYGLSHELSFSNTHNRAQTGTEYSAHYSFAYSVMRRWTLCNDALRLYAGGMAGASVGVTYNSHNGNNNPAQGYGNAEIGMHLGASYKWKMWGREITAGYEARLPLLGLMFSPNYGQSYYEIFYRGDYDRNIVLTSPATFQMRQQFSIDVELKENTSLRVGYLCDIRQAKPNNLLQHHYFNGVIVGVKIRK